MAGGAVPRCEFDSEDLIVRYETILPGDVKEIGPAVAGAMQLVRMMGCAAGKEADVELALQEALANAVVHGCKGDTNKRVQFCVTCDEARGMLIIVRDPGTGFDPASLPSPVQGQQIYSTHGRGIYLINRLMDEVRFEKGGTEIHMRKR